jgi:hypothetical protein
MSHSVRRLAIVGIATALVMPRVARAATPAVDAPPHLRPLNAEARTLASELLERSATARDMTERLEQSDVIVYIRFRLFDTATLDGRVGFLESAAHNHGRLLVVELAVGRTRIQQLVTLAHELRHAVEIADAPTVVDPLTMADYYARVSRTATCEPGRKTFETREAGDTAAQVRLELMSRATRTEPHESR